MQAAGAQKVECPKLPSGKSAVGPYPYAAGLFWGLSYDVVRWIAGSRFVYDFWHNASAMRGPRYSPRYSPRAHAVPVVATCRPRCRSIISTLPPTGTHRRIGSRARTRLSDSSSTCHLSPSSRRSTGDGRSCTTAGCAPNIRRDIRRDTRAERRRYCAETTPGWRRDGAEMAPRLRRDTWAERRALIGTGVPHARRAWPVHSEYLLAHYCRALNAHCCRF